MAKNDYDISKAFKRIEEELIASMMRNLDHHRAMETDEGIEWTQWQVEQLSALQRYRVNNEKKYGKEFAKINKAIPQLIRMARAEGNMDQEAALMEAAAKGAKISPQDTPMTAEFFGINDRKIDALVNATINDMTQAEYAVLRKANDDYRQIIYDAQVYANVGGTTYEKAVDMATKDFLSRGIQCIEYSNGAKHTIEDYSDMAIKTATKRAYLTGEGEMRNKWGEHLVIINKRTDACPKCMPFAGKIMIDDVWSGGTAEDGPYPLLSTAIAAGLYHPRCRDSHTTYFPGISTPPEGYKKEELKEREAAYDADQKQKAAEKNAEKYERLEKYSLDLENKSLYARRADQLKSIEEKRFRTVRFRTGRQTSKEYAESKRLSDELQKRLRERFGLSTSQKTIQRIYDEAALWEKRLEDDERKYIVKYTKNAGDRKPKRLFERLNAMLRGDAEKDSKLEYIADQISSGLSRFSLEEDIICYRKSNWNMASGVDIGDVFIPKQFISTSIDEDATIKGDFSFTIYVKKGSKGALIEEISEYHDQKEFLLDKDCMYRLISKKGKHIALEVI